MSTHASAAPASAAGTTIALSLVSHTNVGKTTLARTLLGRDIGEVRDEAHVTQAAEQHTLIATPQGDRLELWDTPGFGDSVRLAKRLAQAGNPIGWFLAEVWDRYRHRAFWASQRAARNVIEQADVVLYLVNASEPPESAGYLDAELQVLALLGKPVVALLNQLGAPRGPAEEAAEIGRWRAHLGERVLAVLALDAFARCWVQEGVLLRALDKAVPEPKRDAFERLSAAWDERNLVTWRASMHELARRVARAALDRQALPQAGAWDRVKDLGGAVRDSVGNRLGLKRDQGARLHDAAMLQLAERLAADERDSTNRLIALHGLGGHAAERVLRRVAEQFAVQAPLDEGKAALWGGAVTGALAGLKADVLSGGLTLGGGLLAGGLLGALGALGLARGVNKVRGVEVPTFAWSPAALDALVRSALLGYLAVAHFGRGRGDWAAAEHPAFWADAVDRALAPRRDALHALWETRDELLDDTAPDAAPDPDHAASTTTAAASALATLQARLEPLLRDSCAALLDELYPGARA